MASVPRNFLQQGELKGLLRRFKGIPRLRRVDQIDTKLWDWRHQIEEELRGRLQEAIRLKFGAKWSRNVRLWPYSSSSCGGLITEQLE